MHRKKKTKLVLVFQYFWRRVYRQKLKQDELHSSGISLEISTIVNQMLELQKSSTWKTPPATQEQSHVQVSIMEKI